MAIATTRGDIDAVAHQLAQQAFSLTANVSKFKAWLDQYSATDLTAVAFGYNIGDANDLKSAVSELADWGLVFNNSTSAFVTGTHDYRIFPRRMLTAGMY